MTVPFSRPVNLLAGLFWSLPPLAVLVVLRLAAGAPVTAAGLLLSWSFVLGVLIFSWLAHPGSLEWKAGALTIMRLGLAAAGVLAGLVYAATRATPAAWGLLLVFFGLLLAVEKSIETRFQPRLPLLAGWLLRCLFAGLAGGFAVAIAQVETRFSEEEFFVALQAVGLAMFWLAFTMFPWRRANFIRAKSPHEGFQPGVSNARRRSQTAILIAFLAAITLLGSLYTVRAYQHSFYSAKAPGYAQITSDSPFLCGQAAPDPQAYDSEETFQRVLKLVEANPHRGAPEYGMLALGTGEARWAEDFRRSLLEEAAAMRFTGPAQSVKYIQYEASQRAYYYPRVRSAFPGLFTPAEEEQILQWFGVINRRALTVEWVDWMYALAFSKLPEGPYENQETGAGLLALLEAHNLNDPSLSTRNRDYLSRNLRGWSQRFRVTDDAVVYQPEWMNNSFFQSLFTKQADNEAVRRSYEWLLAQALPDGSPLQYNHPGFITMADHAYPAADLLQDERFVWLSARAADYLEASQGSLAAKPGLEEAAGLDGTSPDLGSCLLYGDSGLPNQAGPLAPDKLVFRDGWTTDSVYLLLNLRFTGWHRYKATNTLTLLYQSGRLAGDEMSGEAFSWLPSGRSHFRDKRVPRENLNGLAVERSGMSAVLYSLTGIGGPWAQDPPFYASVESFETGAGLDSSRTTIEDWHGWNHHRSVYFYHQGPAVIVDSARGPAGREASLYWHITSSTLDLQGRRISLRSGPAPAELLLLPVSPGELRSESGEATGETLDAIQFRASTGRLDLVSIFLTRDWAGAQAQIQPEGEGYRLLIENGSQKIVLPLSFE